MAEQEGGQEKTELPTPRRLQEMLDSGQFARSPEIQTVFLIGVGLLVLTLAMPRMFAVIKIYMAQTFAQLGSTQVTVESFPAQFAHFLTVAGTCLLPIMAAGFFAALVGSGVQSRFQLAPKGLDLKWARLSPMKGFKNIFGVQSAVRLVVAVLKFIVIFGFTYPVIREVMDDPIFYAATDFDYFINFMASTAQTVTIRVLAGMMIIAGVDYAYQLWKTEQDSMMTRDEVKEETKSNEGNQQVKGEVRRRRRQMLRQKWQTEVPKADVIITNPTRLAVALRYDRKNMGAPRVVAKGARFNALRIRELAKQHQIPIIENKPVAQLLFKHCKVGQDIIPQLYAAVAEILAHVYRTNRYRYYKQGIEIPK